MAVLGPNPLQQLHMHDLPAPNVTKMYWNTLLIVENLEPPSTLHPVTVPSHGWRDWTVLQTSDKTQRAARRRHIGNMRRQDAPSIF